MKLQVLRDDNGKPTGVFIPIAEWNKLREKFDLSEIPESQILEVRERLEDYHKNPNQALDFGEVMDDLEKDL